MNLLFSTEDSAKRMSNSDRAKMQPGIYKDVTLQVNLINGVNPNDYSLVLNFINAKGELIQFWASYPDDDVYTFKDETLEEAKQRNYDLTVNQLAYIASVVKGEKFSASGNTWPEFLSKFEQFFKANDSFKLNLKVIATAKGNPTIPYKPNGWLQKYEKGKEPTLVFLAKELVNMSTEDSKDSDVDLGNII